MHKKPFEGKAIQTDRPTDIVTYRVVCTRLKRNAGGKQGGKNFGFLFAEMMEPMSEEAEEEEEEEEQEFIATARGRYGWGRHPYTQNTT